ncbi:TPA: hypothetical protein ACSTL0_004049 [Serratia fonticola]
MLELNEDKSNELLKYVEMLWLSNKMSESKFKYLIEEIKEGKLESAEKYLISRGFDEELLTDNELYSKNLEIGKFDNEFINYKNNKEKVDVWRNRCHEFEKKNAFLTSEINNINTVFRETKEKTENLLSTLKKYEEDKVKLSQEIHRLASENNELKNKFQQKRIDEKIPEYVEDVSQKLDKADDFFTKMSMYWSIAGITLAILAVIAAFCTFIYGLETIADVTKLTPTSIVYTFMRGGIGIALLSWIAYISFSNARNYTHESILRKDRQHALTFGRLFLQIYGSTATKEDAINVFKDWNMSGDTAFSSKSKTPPNPMSYIESMKNMFSRSSNANKDSSKEDD